MVIGTLINHAVPITRNPIRRFLPPRDNSVKKPKKYFVAQKRRNAYVCAVPVMYLYSYDVLSTEAASADIIQYIFRTDVLYRLQFSKLL